MKLYVFPDRDGRWHWETASPVGTVPEHSAQSFANVELAMNAARTRFGPAGVAFIVGQPPRTSQ